MTRSGRRTHDVLRMAASPTSPPPTRATTAYRYAFHVSSAVMDRPFQSRDRPASLATLSVPGAILATNVHEVPASRGGSSRPGFGESLAELDAPILAVGATSPAARHPQYAPTYAPAKEKGLTALP